MLNVKFIIDDQYTDGVGKRQSALGPVWLVDEVVQLAHANEDIVQINHINTKIQAKSQARKTTA